MKKLILIILAGILVISFSGCTSTSTAVRSSNHTHELNFCKPKGKIVSYIEDVSDDVVSFEGKEYTLVHDDEFDDVDETNFSMDSLFMNMVEGNFVFRKDADKSWLASKVYGYDDWEYMMVDDVDKDKNVRGKKAYYTEDGILHMKQFREKNGKKELHVFAPGIQSYYVVERKSLIEIRYKMPVFGKDVCYHFGFNGLEENKWVPNEQGWDFQQMFFNETLSGKSGYIRYNPSIWLGKYNENREDSWIDFAVPDFQKKATENWSWDTPQNMFDDTTAAYPMPDSAVNEWHTVQVVYDEEGYAVYHDNLKIYEWRWEDHPECGLPLGGYYLAIQMGMCGDWTHFGLSEENKWVGKFDINDPEYDLQIDYVRVWERK